MVLGASVLLMSSCKGKEETQEDQDLSAMRSELLHRAGSGLIAPSYLAFVNQATKVQDEFDAYAAGDQSKLSTVRSEFNSLYTLWQNVNIYEFGPAKTRGFRGALNTFPTDSGKIVQNLLSGGYNLDELNMADARGLPAMDFLLNAMDESGTNDQFLNGLDAGKYVDYFKALIPARRRQCAGGQ